MYQKLMEYALGVNGEAYYFIRIMPLPLLAAQVASLYSYVLL